MFKCIVVKLAARAPEVAPKKVKLTVSTRSVARTRPALLGERRAPRHVQSRGEPLGVALPREHVGDFFVLFALRATMA